MSAKPSNRKPSRLHRVKRPQVYKVVATSDGMRIISSMEPIQVKKEDSNASMLPSVQTTTTNIGRRSTTTAPGHSLRNPSKSRVRVRPYSSEMSTKKPGQAFDTETPRSNSAEHRMRGRIGQVPPTMSAWKALHEMENKTAGASTWDLVIDTKSGQSHLMLPKSSIGENEGKEDVAPSIELASPPGASPSHTGIRNTSAGEFYEEYKDVLETARYKEELGGLLSELGAMTKRRKQRVNTSLKRTKNQIASPQHGISSTHTRATVFGKLEELSSPGGSRARILSDQPSSLNHARPQTRQQLAELAQTVLAVKNGLLPICEDQGDLPFQLAFERHSLVPKVVVDLQKWCTRINDVSLNKFLCLCPSSLKVLILSGAPYLNDTALNLIGQRCKQLTVLHLQNCISITDKGITSLVESCGETLQILDVALTTPAINRMNNILRAIPLFEENCLPGGAHQVIEPVFDVRFVNAQNNITDKGVRSVAHYCPNLKTLFLGNRNAITDTSLYLLARGAPQLEELDINGCNNITTEGIVGLGTCSFRWLRLPAGNKLNDTGLQAILSNSRRLEFFDASGTTELTDDGVRGLLEVKVMWGFKQHSGYRLMTNLDLSDCQRLTDVALSWLSAGCPTLSSLKLRRCRAIRDYGLRSIAMLQKLKILALSDCVLITDEGILLLCNNGERLDARAMPAHPLDQQPSIIKGMKRLDISGCIQVSDVGLVTVARAFPKLVSVCLANLPKITNGAIRVVAQELSHKLRSLHLGRNPQITVEGFGALARHCHKLVDIRLHHSDVGVDDQLVRELKNLPRVQTLDLGFCRRITDQCIRYLPTWKLVHLSLAGNLKLTDTAIELLADVSRDLERLDISKCDKLSNRSVETLWQDQRCPKLCFLNVHGCTMITKQALLEFVNSRPHMYLKVVIDQQDDSKKSNGTTQPFSGVRVSRFGESEQHQLEFFDYSTRVLTAVVQLQCFYRQACSRSEFKRRVAQHLKFVVQNVTLIQRTVRGWQARTMTRMLRNRCEYIACRMQYLFRRWCNKRNKAAALRFWRLRLTNAAFIAWRENATQQRIERLEAERLEDERINAENLSKAWKHWSLGQRGRLFKLWRENAKQQRQEREALAAAIKFWKTRVVKEVFQEWADVAMEAVVRKKALVKVFMNCVSLETYNSTKDRSNCFVSTQHSKHRIQRHCINILRDTVQQRKKALRSAISLHQATFFASVGKVAFQAWVQEYKFKKDMKFKIALGVKVVEKHAMLKGIKALKTFAKDKTVRRALAAKAAYHLLNQRLLQSFNSWKQLLVLKAEKERKKQKALEYMKDAMLRKTFKHWALVSNRKATQRSKVAASLSKLINGTLNRVWQTWKSMVVAKKRLKLRVSNRLMHQGGAVAVSVWVKAAAYSYYYRRSQLQQWEVMHNVATRIQARWRGGMDREKMEEKRLLMQFMSVKIQAMVRRKLARLQRKRQERYAILREHVRLDRELEQMEYEEEIGRMLVRQRTAALVIQRQLRARFARDRTFRLRGERQRKQILEERDDAARVMKEHAEKELEREEIARKEMSSILLIQRTYRGAVGRIEFQRVWLKRVLDQLAVIIQKSYRMRIGRRVAEGRKRDNYIKQQVRSQVRASAKVMRKLGIGRRDRQRKIVVLFDRIGIHPETFQLSKRALLKEVWVDANWCSKVAQGYTKAIVEAKTNSDLRTKLITQHIQRIQEEEMVHKGESVQIVAPEHSCRGQTGFVLDVKKVANVPGGAQAAVKLDRDASVVFVSMKTFQTPECDSRNSMIQFPRMALKLSNVVPSKVQNNKNKLLLRAEELREERTMHVAARIVQRNFRRRKMMNYFREQIVIQNQVDKERKEQLLNRLQKYHIAYAQTGRLLVSLGIIWPRYIPEMPEKAIQPKWMKSLSSKIFLRHQQHQEVGKLMREWKMRLKLLRQSDESSKLLRRWRKRTLRRVAFWTAIDKVSDGVLRKLAKPIDDLAYVHQDNRFVHKILAGLCSIVGGPEYKRTEVDKTTWIGMFQFEALKNSLHLSGAGTAMYHGTWRSGIPHGEGFALFTTGASGYGRPERARDSRGFLVPQYYSISSQFSFGVPKGEAEVAFVDGSVYTGPYVMEAGDGQGVGRNMEEHKGQWVSSNGVVWEGNCVDNHFNPLDVTADKITKRFKNGNVYEGGMLNGKEHGEGRMEFMNGDTYTGDWVNGEKHGNGSYRTSSGGLYVGEWVEDEKHGFGKQSFEDGSMYEGFYVESMWQGEGKLVTVEGDTYQGDFDGSMFNGHGVMKYRNGAVYSGTWLNGMRHTSEECAVYIDENGDRYTVPFLADKMDGKGEVVKATLMGWNLEEYNVWKQGEIVRKLGVGVNPLATNEFCEKFQVYGDYSSPFAEVLAQQLPQLPPGVDPLDRRVEQHVNGILVRAGDIGGTALLERCDDRLQTLLPQLEELDTDLQLANEALEEQIEDEEQQEEFVDELEVEVKEIDEELRREIETLENFWVSDPSVSRLQFEKSIESLKGAQLGEWFQCTQVRRPPAIWVSLWTALCILFGIPPKTLEMIMLCKNSRQNQDLGDKFALIRPYDVKLLDEVMRWDVYEKAAEPNLVEKIAVHVYNPSMKPENMEISQVAPVASKLVIFLRSAYQYMKKCREVLKRHRHIAQLERKLEFEKSKLEEERIVLTAEREKSKLLRKESLDLLAEKQEIERSLDEVRALLKQMELSLKRAEEERAKGLPPDDARIIPWMSREEEEQVRQVKERLDELVDLLCVPGLLDVMIDMKERVVSEHNFREAHPYPTYLRIEVFDHVYEMVNKVAENGRVEIEVEEAMDAIILKLEGVDAEIESCVTDAVYRVSILHAYETFIQEREEKYLWKTAMIRDTASDQEYTGTCISVYDYDRVVLNDPEPGQGLVYYDGLSATVYGFRGFEQEVEDDPDNLNDESAHDEQHTEVAEGYIGDGTDHNQIVKHDGQLVNDDDGVALIPERKTIFTDPFGQCTRFESDFKPGYQFLIPLQDGAGIEERTVVRVIDDFTLELDAPVSEYCESLGDWSKDWGRTIVDDPPVTVSVEVADVEYYDTTVEYAVDLDRITVDPVE